MDILSDLKEKSLPILQIIKAKANLILITIIGLLLLCQFSFLTMAVSKNVDNWSIIFSMDNDAANTIRVA